MKDKSQTKLPALPEEEANLWDFFVAVGVKGGDELRKELGLDEVNFRHLAPNVNREPKRYFLYRIFDEIQKAALRIAYWKEYLSEESNDLQRIDFESVIDEQQFRARKLSEALVDAILFSTTNDEGHYGDYLFIHELNECARSQEDRHEFFGFHNRNTQFQANWLCDEIAKLEKAGLDPKSRWYIKSGKVMNKDWTTKGVPFSSFRQRYKQILSIAFPSELTVLGKTYIHAYGMSKDVHFTPHDTSSAFEEEEILRGANRVGLLILALVIRCQHLIGRVPDGVNKQYREMHDGNKEPAELARSLKKKPAQPGDIVWIQGDYAEVLEVTTSKYGYPAYHVKYIEHSPLSEVPDDWFAGFEVRLVAKKTDVEKAASAVAEEILKSTGKHEDQTEVLEYAKRAAIKLSKHIQQLRRQAARISPTEAKEPIVKPDIPPQAG